MRTLEEWREEDESSGRQQLRSIVDSRAWKEVVVPAIESAIRSLEQTVAFNRSCGIEEVRFLQGQHSVWRMLLKEPMAVLTRPKHERGE